MVEIIVLICLKLMSTIELYLSQNDVAMHRHFASVGEKEEMFLLLLNISSSNLYTSNEPKYYK